MPTPTFPSRALFMLGVMAWFGPFSGAISANAAIYYVATDGNDANNGTSLATPFATPHKAITATLAPGDTIYIRGGNYSFNSKISPGSSKVGTAGNPIKFWAYADEKPVFDFSGLTPTSDKALDLRRNYWHVRGIEVKNAPNTGILVAGLGTIIEGCAAHDCGFDGIVLGSSSSRTTNALILNCDSYRNYQTGSDGNQGDGFAGKSGCGPGNIFHGCRAWNNADDGWDFYDAAAQPVVLENCWAFSNGYDLWNYGAGWSGNGNGFKLGGAATSVTHLVTNSVAFGNRLKGFDHNNSHGGHTVVNCTGYANGGANFSFFDTPNNGTFNRMINNASFGGTLTNLDPTCVQVSNSWQIVSVSATDFASLNTAVATNARNTDFSLPTNSLFRLSASSQLIDRGLNVGLPFTGVRPDLGAFEYAIAIQTPAMLSATGSNVNNGTFRFVGNGFTAHGNIVVHASSNLNSWTPIYTNPPTVGAFQFVDSNSPSIPKRFYRIEEK